MTGDAATSGFISSSGLAALVLLLSFITFSFIRNKFRDVYQYRRLLHQLKSYDDFNGKRVGVPSALPREKPFHWVSAALSMSESEIVKKIGLGTAMYLRYMRTMLYCFGIISVLAILILMPVYGTGNFNKRTNATRPAPTDDVTTNSTDQNATVVVSGLRVITLSNVVSGDPRMWGTVLFDIVTTAVFVYFLFFDYRKFAEYRRKDFASENPKNYSIAVFDIPEEHNSEEDIKNIFEVIVPNQVANVICAKDSARATKLSKELDAAVANREKSEWLSANKLDGEPHFDRVGCCGAVRLWQEKVNAKEHWESEYERIRTEIVEENDKARKAPCAVVIFKNKRAPSLLTQANMASDNTQWNVYSMPEPKAVNWAAFKVPGYQAQIRRISVFIFVVSLTLFWSIPAFGIASLVSLDRAAEEFEFLAPVLNWNSELKGLIQGLLPAIILSIFVALIPVVIRFFVSKERIHSIHHIDRKTRDYFYFFTIYASFFCIVLGSSILHEIRIIATNFDVPKAFTLLGSSIPGQSLFFATFIAIQTGIATSLELLNPVRLVLVWVLKKMAKTEREKRAAEGNGRNPELFKMYGQGMLIGFIGIMYAPMAPLVPVLAFIYFGYAYLVHRYNLIFNLYQESDSSGESYIGAFWGTMLALALRSTVLGVILAAKSSAAAAFCALPLIMAIAAGIYIYRRYRRVSEYGSLHDLFLKESELPNRYINLYDQPCTKPGDYLNLNGIDEVDDYHENRRGIQ